MTGVYVKWASMREQTLKNNGRGKKLTRRLCGVCAITSMIVLCVFVYLSFFRDSSDFLSSQERLDKSKGPKEPKISLTKDPKDSTTEVAALKQSTVDLMAERVKKNIRAVIVVSVIMLLVLAVGLILLALYKTGVLWDGNFAPPPSQVNQVHQNPGDGNGPSFWEANRVVILSACIPVVVIFLGCILACSVIVNRYGNLTVFRVFKFQGREFNDFYSNQWEYVKGEQNKESLEQKIATNASTFSRFAARYIIAGNTQESVTIRGETYCVRDIIELYMRGGPICGEYPGMLFLQETRRIATGSVQNKSLSLKSTAEFIQGLDLEGLRQAYNDINILACSLFAAKYNPPEETQDFDVSSGSNSDTSP